MNDISGPAFPLSFVASRDCIGFEGEQVESGITSTYRGITVRDYFAAKALQGLLSDPDEGPEDGNLDEFMRGAAIACYEYADAMLEARK